MTEYPTQLTRHQEKLIDASTAIRGEPPSRIDFLHTIQCQLGLPYKNPGDQVREWDRKQGNASLRIEAGSAMDPQTGKFVHLGLPYGEKPRLVLIHLASEAVRTGNPVVDVENTMTSFARSLGLETNGRQLKGLKDQLARLASATIRMGVVEEGRAVQVNTQIVAAFDLWFPKKPDQRGAVALDRSTKRRVFPEPGQTRRPARPSRRRRPFFVLDGARCLCLAGPAAAPHPARQTPENHLGRNV